MSRLCLRELDSLEYILADACYRVDRDVLAKEGTVLIDYNKDKCSLRANLKYNNILQAYGVELQEEQNLMIQANLLKKVTITGLHKDSLVLKPDHFMVQHFRGRTWNKACDYLILTRFNDEDYAFFIELKTSISLNPDDHARLVFKGFDYDSGMIWQMIGANVLFDNLIEVVYKSTKYHALYTGPRAKSHLQELKGCATSQLAKYKRIYVVLYSKVIAHPNTTVGGIRKTGMVVPNEASLERDVYALQIDDESSRSIGELIACAGS